MLTSARPDQAACGLEKSWHVSCAGYGQQRPQQHGNSYGAAPTSYTQQNGYTPQTGGKLDSATTKVGGVLRWGWRWPLQCCCYSPIYEVTLSTQHHLCVEVHIIALCASTGAATGYPSQTGYPPYGGQPQYGQPGYGAAPGGYPPYGGAGAQYPPYGGGYPPAQYGGYPPAQGVRHAGYVASCCLSAAALAEWTDLVSKQAWVPDGLRTICGWHTCVLPMDPLDAQLLVGGAGSEVAWVAWAAAPGLRSAWEVACWEALSWAKLWAAAAVMVAAAAAVAVVAVAVVAAVARWLLSCILRTAAHVAQ